MLSLCNCSDSVFAVPQNAITPNDIYQASLKGENVDMSSFAFKPEPNGKELDEPPLEQMRGTDIVDLWNKEQEVLDAKANVVKRARNTHHELNR